MFIHLDTDLIIVKNELPEADKTLWPLSFQVSQATDYSCSLKDFLCTEIFSWNHRSYEPSPFSFKGEKDFFFTVSSQCVVPLYHQKCWFCFNVKVNTMTVCLSTFIQNGVWKIFRQLKYFLKRWTHLQCLSGELHPEEPYEEKTERRMFCPHQYANTMNFYPRKHENTVNGMWWW